MSDQTARAIELGKKLSFLVWMSIDAGIGDRAALYAEHASIMKPETVDNIISVLVKYGKIVEIAGCFVSVDSKSN